jgi:cytochrome c-type biogenesis protein CcmH/NrfG
VARGTQHRKRRSGPNARKAVAPAVAAPRKQRPPQWQEELFFQRLRVHAKPAFVLLAAVFALGFVFLGIGSGSNGITDALQNAFNFGGGSSGTSISKLEHKTQKSPLDAQAWRDLATAYETKQRPNDAVVALSQYVGLRPKDANAFAELASQYKLQANQYAQDYQDAQARGATFTPLAAAFAPPATSPLGKALNDPKALQNPISSVLQEQAQSGQQTALTNYQTSLRNAEDAYQKLVKLTPKDANAQIQLAQTAQAAGDTKAAVTAYKRFLVLAPQDPTAPTIRKQVKALEKQLAPPASSKTASK